MAKKAEKILKDLLGEPMSFATLLRAIRTRDDLTQRDLADKLGVTVSLISDLENSRKLVTVERAVGFAHKLNESERYFIYLALQDQVNRADRDYKVVIA